MKKRHLTRKILLIMLAGAVAVTLYILISGYIKSLPKLQYTFSQAFQNTVTYPDARFAVISDLHYYDTSLGTSGSAYEKCLHSDRKLLADTADLLDFAIDNIIASGSKFVLIPGDLTKDGELVGHQKVSAALSKLVEHGLKVYVIPGNHDISNPEAFKFEGDKTIPVANITPLQFADIYSKYGYDSALYRDNNSLSYVAEPIEGLWLIAIDSCRYEENQPGGKETIGGNLLQDQEKWLENILKMAGDKGKAVMVMEHHGIVEHWTGQGKLHPEYLIQDYKYFGRMLASYDVRLAFTGHYHAQDVSLGDFGSDGIIYDIETGSLATSPCAVRYCAIEGNKINIASSYMIGLIHPDTDFEKNAGQFVYDTVEKEAFETLREYYVPGKDAKYIAGYVAAGFVEHYKGSENEAEKPDFDENKLGFWSRIVYNIQKYVPEGMWRDLKPLDDNISLDLSGN